MMEDRIIINLVMCKKFADNCSKLVFVLHGSSLTLEYVRNCSKLEFVQSRHWSWRPPSSWISGCASAILNPRSWHKYFSVRRTSNPVKHQTKNTSPEHLQGTGHIVSPCSVRESAEETEEQEKLKRIELKDGDLEGNIKVVARRTPSLR